MIPETDVVKAGRQRPCSQCKGIIKKGEHLLVVTTYSSGQRGLSYHKSVSYCRLCAVKVLQDKVKDSLIIMEELLGLIGEGA